MECLKQEVELLMDTPEKTTPQQQSLPVPWLSLPVESKYHMVGALCVHWRVCNAAYMSLRLSERRGIECKLVL